MDLQSRKIAFVQEFLRLQNEELISSLEKLLWQKQKESDISPMSEEQFNREIDQALEDSSKGRITKASDLKEKVKDWK